MQGQVAAAEYSNRGLEKGSVQKAIAGYEGSPTIFPISCRGAMGAPWISMH